MLEARFEAKPVPIEYPKIIILLCSIYSFSQKTTIKGSIKDQQNRSIQSASVSLFDEKDNFLGYNFTNENGNYSITFENKKYILRLKEIFRQLTEKNINEKNKIEEIADNAFQKLANLEFLRMNENQIQHMMNSVQEFMQQL